MVTRLEAARFVCLPPSKFDELVRDGRMPKPAKIDDIEIFDLVQLDLALDAITGGSNEANEWNRRRVSAKDPP